MKKALLAVAFVAFAACSKKAETDAAAGPGEPVVTGETDAPAGTYTLDKAHSTLLFRVNHIGFSRYVGRFADFDATLMLDPKRPEEASIIATIDPASLEVPPPPEGFLETLLGPDWLNAGAFPEMTFRSTRIERTGRNTAIITGDLTFHGVTAPVSLDATFNGGYAGHSLEPQARIGFSATGSLQRSAFGVDHGIPAAGTNMGVGDRVEIMIETEFNGPAWRGAATE